MNTFPPFILALLCYTTLTTIEHYMNFHLETLRGSGGVTTVYNNDTNCLTLTLNFDVKLK